MRLLNSCFTVLVVSVTYSSGAICAAIVDVSVWCQNGCQLSPTCCLPLSQLRESMFQLSTQIEHSWTYNWYSDWFTYKQFEALNDVLQFREHVIKLALGTTIQWNALIILHILKDQKEIFFFHSSRFFSINILFIIMKLYINIQVQISNIWKNPE